MNEGQLDGVWVGEHVGDGSDDTWRMVVRHPWAHIEQTNASGESVSRFEGMISVLGMPFSFGHKIEGLRVTVLDEQHVLVRQAENEPGGANDDIVFSRPGLPELTAEQSYGQLRGFHAPMPVFYLTRWAVT